MKRLSAILLIALAGACAGPNPPIANESPNDNGNLNGSTVNGNANDTPNQKEICDTAGVICTVAGTGFSLFDGDGKPAVETSLYYPFDVQFDEQDRPLILDWNNLRVRRINDDGTIETIIGTDFEANPIDGALAVDTALHHTSDIQFDSQWRLWMAGDHSPVIFQVDTEGIIHVLAGGDNFGYDGDGGPALDATLNTPFGVEPDNLGGFYFTDEAEHVVRYVNPDGIISTVAGTGDKGYSGDGGPGTAALLNGPTRLKLRSADKLYICDTRNHAIRLLDLATGTITTYAGKGQAGFAGDGGPASGAQLSSPYDIVFSPAGDMYIADSGNDVIRRIDADGMVSTVAGTPEISGFEGDEGAAADCVMNRPSAINFAPDGALWIADMFNHRVRRVAGFLPQ